MALASALTFRGEAQDGAAKIPKSTAYQACSARELSGVSTAEFLERAHERVSSYLLVSAFHAEMLARCTDLFRHEDASFFEKLGRTAAEARASCRAELGNLQAIIAMKWSDMRVALALSAPVYREDRLRDAVPTRLNPRAQHPFGDAVKMPPLGAQERQRALERFARQEDRLRREFRLTRGGEPFQPWSPAIFEQAEERFVLRGIERFRASEQDRYFALLGSLPLLAYLDTGTPGMAALGYALERIRGNSGELLAQLRRDGKDHPELYAPFSALIESLLRAEPGLCSGAETWFAEVEAHRKLMGRIDGGLFVLTILGSMYGPTHAVKLVSEVVGVALKGLYVYHAWERFETDYLVALATVTNPAEVADFGELSHKHRVFLLGSFMFHAKALPLVDDVSLF
ncbi:MAG: hypothetical protein NDJ89_12600 [Oligoflexia bacterium]|nr:hypothetical protein [Oligoflexia bacterium]